MDDVREFVDQFGLPEWALIGLLVLVVLSKVAGGLTFVGKLAAGLWRAAKLRVGAWRTDADERHRLRQRMRFADHLRGRLLLLDDKEQWSDDRYAELEAEIELRSPTGRSLRLRPRRQNGNLRREPSLSRALERSQEQLILLQGEPGSGKSVALRHLARRMLKEATADARSAHVIPLYINLKGLGRTDDEAVDADLIERFVRATLADVSNADVDRFLDEELPRGEREGTWLFLFDSFDEIPDILGATHADAVVLAYSTALYEFLSGLRACRGIVSSRQFRAPQGVPWPIWNVLPLGIERQRDLVRQSSLSPAQRTSVLGSLTTADPGVISMSTNPMFLGLLCDYVATHKSFPSSSHVVFEGYVVRRLERDAERVERKFHLDAGHLRRMSELFAYVLTAADGLGLAPTRARLAEACQRFDAAPATDVMAAMDALEYIKLARSENDAALPEARTFSFSHRRFQEYFATCEVLNNVGLVDAEALILDGRWRETAVTLCQLQAADAQPLLAAAGDRLRSAAQRADPGVADDASRFAWDMEALHVLLLLQQGFAGREQSLPAQIRADAATIVGAALDGNVHDRKLAVEASGCLADERFTAVLVDAFSDDSDWVQDQAYLQLSRVRELSPRLGQEVRRTLVRRVGRTDLHAGPEETQTLLMRLPEPALYLRLFAVLRRVRLIDAVLLAAVFVGLCVAFPTMAVQALLFIVLVTGLSWLSLGRLASATALAEEGEIVRWLSAPRAERGRPHRPTTNQAPASDARDPSIKVPAFVRSRLEVVPIGVLAVFLRLALVSLTLFVQGNAASVAGCLIASAFALTWTPAFLAAAAGIHPPRSTVIYVLPQVALARRLLLIVAAMGRHRRRAVDATVVILPLALLAVGLMVLAVKTPDWVGSLMFAPVAILALYWMKLSVQDLLTVHADRRWLARWKPQAALVTDDTLLGWITALKSEHGLVTMLKRLRTSKALFDASAQDRVRDVLDLRRRASTRPSAPIGGDSATLVWTPEILVRLTPAVIDELGRLLEGLQEQTTERAVAVPAI